MANKKESLSATNLADFHHLNCDLYLWLTYNGGNPDADSDSSKGPSRSELTRAQFHRGEEWEATLLAWLDSKNLLMRLPRDPITADVLQEHILSLDGIEHIFIAGLIFQPPQAALSKRFSDASTTPVKFGMAKPDLVEVVLQDGKAVWKVIDAKASSSVKTSHLAQTYFYTLCLNYILDHPFFQSANNVGVWLPPSSGLDVYEPSFSDMKTIDTALLSATLDDFLFRRLPRILHQPRDSVQWHLNPLCKSCRFESDCRKTTINSGKLGKIPNISLRDASVFKDLFHFSRLRPTSTSTDIEDLHLIVTDHNVMHRIAQQSPMTAKKAKQLLALPRRPDPSSTITSPILQAARTDSVQIVPRLNHTFPSSESIAIVLSLVTDPATPDRNIQAFCISTRFSDSVSYDIKDYYSGRKGEFIKTLATLIRTICGTQETNDRPFSVQFYVWSVNERSNLQRCIIQAALSEDIDTDDIRLCIGALAEGASLLQTIYQPLLLSDALVRLKKEYQVYARNSTEDRRQRVEAAMRRIETQNSTHESAAERKREFGQVPRVVALQKEVERSFALPISGYWDLPECATVMLSSSQRESCPSDEKLYKAYKDGNDADFLSLLYTRNYFLLALLDEVRKRLKEASLLVNEARLFSVQLMDLCRNDTLRKLFYMQQFEVLTKLGELWNSRIDGCPDAPILEYRSKSSVNTPTEYRFKLVSGMIEAPPDKWTLYDYLLVRDSTSFDGESPIPVEALFDDLAVSGLVFPLNRSTTAWTAQPSIVQERLAVAAVINVKAVGRETIVTLNVWKARNLGLEAGVHYRLSPRYVDFNIPKVLSSLFEVDLQCETAVIDLGEDRAKNLAQVPYLHFILEPQSFGRDPLAEKSLEYEAEIQRTLEQLKDLNVAAAGSLVLKSSQQRAVQRILTNRLTVIWGPPGTGKTYTICLSLLRLIQVQERQKSSNRRIIFLTAMTHAAIDALQDKLSFLMDQYRLVDSLSTHWLDDVVVGRVTNGATHKEPPKGLVHIYTGTLYQLYKFAKKKNLKVNTLVVDEAGQISLSYLALAMLFLTPEGRIVVAGDSEQLAPILSGQYPRLNGTAVFGSVLEYLISSYSPPTGTISDSLTATGVLQVASEPRDLVVQLTENFRLNPDLGEFISIIYSCQFKPQKIQPLQLALALERTSMIETNWTSIRMDIWEAIRGFVKSLSAVMLKKFASSKTLKPPRHILSTQEATGILTSSQLSHRPISFALIRLRTQSSSSRHIPYEVHIQGEAVVAAALVEFFKKCSPNDDIFVATPHRIQREAVKTVLEQSPNLGRLEDERVKVDTVERLQGSEAAFVICLFSLPPHPSNDLGFFLERRRLNVAISRAKKLCILVTSDEVLRPSVHILANENAAKGFGFLKAFEARAWSFELEMDLDEED